MPGSSLQHASRADPVPSMPPVGAALLGFAAGGQRWLVDPGQDVQVIDAPITPVPLTRPWYLGLVLLGQRMIAAIDLAGLGGAEPGARKPVERLLLLPERWHTALRVERVYGLRDAAGLRANDAHPFSATSASSTAPAPSTQSAPPARSASSVPTAALPWCGATCFDADGQCWQVLDVAQLCTSPVFLQAGIPQSA